MELPRIVTAGSQRPQFHDAISARSNHNKLKVCIVLFTVGVVFIIAFEDTANSDAVDRTTMRGKAQQKIIALPIPNTDLLHTVVSTKRLHWRHRDAYLSFIRS